MPGKVESADNLRFQGWQKLCRRQVVIFNRVARPHDLGLLEPRDQMYKCELNFVRQTGGDPIYVVLARVASFRFEKELM